jgi:hypothetical protein
MTAHKPVREIDMAFRYSLSSTKKDTRLWKH